MKKYRLNINGREVTGVAGQTILEVARENDIHIPTLCYDERTKIYGSCGLCMCEVEGNPKLCKACATEIAPGMVVRTNTERVIDSRKTNLELLLSNHTGDCRPPCVLACPAQTDCQGYVGLIANGKYEEALELIKDRIPLPAAIGRVCPHPCETECRRALVEEPVSIAQLKRFAADRDLAGDRFIPECKPSTKKTVAVIGGGPMGLSAAYFLRRMGHGVTIYEAMPKAGGMLRYGIPEYRLPKDVLDEEIATIKSMGVEIKTNMKIGTDILFDVLYRNYDAVLIGIGAWVSTGVGCPGEDAEGVIGGIDFLRRVVRNETIRLGERVAVVGGGNTAMDACRTAVRLGAKEVYNIYRRTKDEMPADHLEIKEAEEEGVIFKNLTNPIEVISDENGHVKEVLLQVMELGEPDASGRRKPVPVEGKTERLPVDTVILAIGQAVDSSLFPGEKTKKNAIAYNPNTFMTSIPGVFAGGDCGNDKISIAIESIADARKASEVIDAYLHGEIIQKRKDFVVERHDLSARSFEERDNMFRQALSHLSAEERKDNFTEVIPNAYTEEEAREEASRCLECGCHDYYECKLIDFARQYQVQPARFAGEKNCIEFEDNHPFIVRDPNKCILCGLCVRVCDEVVGVGALGLINRGFDTVVKPNMGKPLAESGCISCGQCVSVCPVGALQERTRMVKETPLKTTSTKTTCSYCSAGCSLILESYGDMLVKANPDKDGAVNQGLICGKGKWGFDGAVTGDKLKTPLIRKAGVLQNDDYHEALVLIAKKCQSVAAAYGKQAVAVSVSDRYTNEEAYAIKKMADLMGAKLLCMNNRECGLMKVLGLGASPNTIEELFSTDLILTVGFKPEESRVISMKIRQAEEAGARVLAIDSCDNSLGILKEIAKAIIDSGRGKNTAGYENFAESLKDVAVSDEAQKIADAYLGAKKAMIVYQQNILTTDAAVLIADIALLSGHIGNPRDGILQIRAKNNSQGLLDMGIRDGVEALEGVRALLVFGENADINTDSLDFLAVCDTHLTALAEKADVVLPGTGFASVDGTYINTERRLLPVKAAIKEEPALNNWQTAAKIAHIFEEEYDWKNTQDIAYEMSCNVEFYRKSVLNECSGGVLAPKASAALVAVDDGKLTDPLPCTDSLMQAISEKLPVPANPTE